ncbi:MAG: HupE/UreJ family protein [Vicinamibacterales bacterium]
MTVSHAQSSRATACAVLLFAAVALQPCPVAAHEIGTTRVALVLDPTGTYDLEIVTDAAVLLERLEAAGGSPVDVPSDAGSLRDRLKLHEDVFRRKVRLTFDHLTDRPVVVWSVTPGSGVGSPVVTIHLRGTVPDGSKDVTWHYAWTSSRYSFSIRRGDDASGFTEWLDGDQSSTPASIRDAATDRSRVRILAQYVALGFTHILPKGIDHVLFVLGVFLLSRKARPVLLQISAFTIAHSITLGLSIYGVVTLPSAVVEPAIALSIAYIAIENIFTKDLKPWRYALVFVFGLLHGLGFAGALSEIGLPREDFLLALLGFNAGVELGQLTVIALAFAAVGYWFRERIWYRQRIVLPASLVIAFLGLYWTVQRLGLA